VGLWMGMGTGIGWWSKWAIARV